MPKTFPALALLVLLVPAAAAGQGVRRAVFAGQFYTADPGRLAAEIDGYLAGAGPAVPPSGRIVGLVAERLDFSGPIALPGAVGAVLSEIGADLPFLSRHRAGITGARRKGESAAKMTTIIMKILSSVMPHLLNSVVVAGEINPVLRCLGLGIELIH